MQRSKEDRARLFSVAPSDRARGNRHKLNYGEFHFKITIRFFYCDGSQTLQEVIQPDSRVSIPGGTQTPAGNSPGQPGLADPALNRQMDLGTTVDTKLSMSQQCSLIVRYIRYWVIV
ncbi:hypothetical protein QYF61_003408 [Mycteria americana]|uniref:Uncharacterized protein n=1 Tax=Mycteria americana TaxID=33587 RepID=A0AAN7NDN4_MYCAM|nr:hypothetical protein QYF61_003408 [Mycteria americana]